MDVPLDSHGYIHVWISDIGHGKIELLYAELSHLVCRGYFRQFALDPFAEFRGGGRRPPPTLLGQEVANFWQSRLWHKPLCAQNFKFAAYFVSQKCFGFKFCISGKKFSDNKKHFWSFFDSPKFSGGAIAAPPQSPRLPPRICCRGPSSLGQMTIFGGAGFLSFSWVQWQTRWENDKELKTFLRQARIWQRTTAIWAAV